MKEIRTEIEIAAPVERVWAVLTDLGTYEDWNPFIEHIEGELRPGARLRVRIRPPGGRAMTLSPAVTDVQPARRFSWLGHLGVRGIFDGEHMHELEPIGSDRTRYVQREAFGGVLVPLVGGVLRKTEEGFRRMNAALKARAEGNLSTVG
jgi:hypothetical protein